MHIWTGKGKKYDYEGNAFEVEYFMGNIWNGKFKDKRVVLTCQIF